MEMVTLESVRMFLCSLCNNSVECYVNNNRCEMMKALDYIHTFEAEPVRHEHWNEQKTLNGNIVYKCSYCGDVAYVMNPYCRICGAKMDLPIE